MNLKLVSSKYLCLDMYFFHAFLMFMHVSLTKPSQQTYEYTIWQVRVSLFVWKTMYNAY